MPPAHHAIVLRFIRRTTSGLADTDPNHDDILRVTKLGENTLRVVYTERSERNTPMIDVMTQTYAVFIAYLYRVFWLLGLDEDPFQSVQVSVPGYPTCLIQVSELRQNLQYLMELIMNSCIAWPASGRLTPSDTTSTAAPPQP
jgi:hypothetical protein